MPGRKIVEELVERFRDNEKAYCNPHYNETQTRREFIDPFFAALGWDVDNRKGYSEVYKEVIHEDAIKVKGGTKAPDYCFRIGGNRKFFVEAKRPYINIHDDADPAFQLRRYAWTAELRLSILTNFRELAVYETRTEPRHTDKASVGRIKYFEYTDYVQEWDTITSIFGLEAILKGSFDRYAESTTVKKGTTRVDTAFLQVIEEWRTSLARNFALRNPSLTPIELNYAVQRTIDRILFLRICEDRAIEDYGSLRKLQDGIYRQLADRFQQADEKYNSGLFHFHKEHDRLEPPDELTLTLTLDDAPLKAIQRQLYYPDSPYEFSVLSADILGQVYEQFLGKVIRLTEGHRAVVEYKPEVRKAGGVFYTPTYIVKHMTTKSVGALCQDKTPKEVASLKILDPACGSGSFLIVAYQYLLDWHLNWYVANDPAKWAKGRHQALYQTGPGGWWLTTTERKRILLNNIYGVDVDAQAVETTKLSLLLKVLEGETSETVGQNLRLFHERALPDLGRNIKCGNSIIAPDLYMQPELPELSADERYRINTFDYHDGFPEIMKRGGFDCIIGNPPYVDIKTLPELEVDYLFTRYKTANNRINLFAAFIEKSLALLGPRFTFSMIVPTAIIAQESYKQLRELVLDKTHVAQMVRLPNESFGANSGDVLVDTVIILLANKSSAAKETEIVSYGAGYKRIAEINPANAPVHVFVNQNRWRKEPDCVWGFNTSSDDQSVLRKCEENTVPLEECANFCLGLTPYDKYKGHTPKQIENQVFHADHRKDETYKKLLAGNDVTRYRVKWNGESWISYGPWLGAPRERRFFTSRRILVKQIIDRTAQRIWAALTDQELYNTQNAFNLIPRDGYEPEYLLGIVNSRLMTYLHRKRYLDEFKRLYQKILIKDCRRLPIRIVDQGDKRMVTLHDKLVAAVKAMIAAVEEYSTVRTPQEQTAIERRILATDRAIDNLVYDLYGLDDSERKIVDAAFASEANSIEYMAHAAK
jgi:type I restriction-modification system DNA methylase subunit